MKTKIIKLKKGSVIEIDDIPRTVTELATIHVKATSRDSASKTSSVFGTFLVVVVTLIGLAVVLALMENYFLSTTSQQPSYDQQIEYHQPQRF